jgi:hypothetical protein
LAGAIEGFAMRRLVPVLFLCLTTALPAQARELRFPKTGAHAFLVDLPKGWRGVPDKRGGLLLVPPATQQHAMVYLGIIVDDDLRGKSDDAVALKAAEPTGIARFDKQEPARITDVKGAVHRGTAFYGKLPEKRGRSRRARIVIVPLAANVWAQAWTVTQPGMSAVETAALNRVLDSLTLAAD